MNIKRIFTIKTAIFAGLLLILFVLFIVTSRLLGPKPEDKPRFGPLEAPKIKQIDPVRTPASQRAEFGDLKQPESAKVYLQNTISLSQDRINAITQNLGFTQGAMQGKLFFAQEEGKFLMINPESGVIFLNQPLPEYLKDFNQNALESFAVILAKPTFLEEKIWENTIISTTYYKASGAHESLAALPLDADSAEVNIFPTLEKRRIIGKDIYPIGEASTITVKFFKDQDSVTLRSSIIAVNFAEGSTYPLKSIDLVKHEVSNNQTVVTAIIPEGRTAKDARYGEVFIPKSAQFTQVELVYYFDTNQDAPLQPMYLLTGKANLEDGTPATIKAIVPAISSEFLQP